MVMTNPWTLDEAADRLGIAISQGRLRVIQDDLEREVASITPFADGLEAIALLRAEGVRVGICSNLCEPYGEAVLHKLPDLDGHVFSYQVGAMKPDIEIYQAICGSLGVAPGHLFGNGLEQVAMAGDSPKCDRDGPRAAGMLGFHLDRRDNGAIRDLVQFAQLVVASRQQRPAKSTR
jgi:FMN phosphatase YigB (HAD superfamily)